MLVLLAVNELPLVADNVKNIANKKERGSINKSNVQVIMKTFKDPSRVQIYEK